MDELWGFVVKNQETLGWLAGGVVTVATGVWAVIKYFFPAKSKKPEVSPSTIRMSGTGISSGRDTHIAGTVYFGLDEEKVRLIVAQSIKPLIDAHEKILADVAHAKNVPTPALRSMWRGYSESGVPLEHLPQVLDAKAYNLEQVRTGLARIEHTSEDLAPFARQARASIDQGNFINAGHSIADTVAAQRRHIGTPANPRTAAEVQILVQQWKTITDMTSNLSKDINDMAMTAVRPLR